MELAVQQYRWTRMDYLIVAIIFGGGIMLGLSSIIFDFGPKSKLPSCFDVAAKAAANPGNKCNPVF
ncbi:MULTISPECIES: hypothetical protein [unclassified Bradyrhizobium]|uniref:hypothetical protein n=1 Tax=Bradyrhizobium sp. USDA 4541 TaxID=2817704 RepID=UPI0020A61CC0|nr:hypothetical protein [Bradyrhizobium sp. USDA 4541]MCP1852779.1 hypothetical protein [Bradyrhizobium sp. USDA 4541]